MRIRTSPLGRLARTAALTTAIVAFGVTSSLATARIGTAAGVSGNVFVTTSGAQRKAQVRDGIRLADRVQTKDDSALQILLLDRTTFTVGQNCVMTIDKFVYDPGTSTGEVSAKVAKGAFRLMSGNIGRSNPESVTVRTPTATLGIRGTFFEGVVGEDAIALAQLGGIDTGGADRNGASIVVLRGPGAVGNTLDTNGIIEITSGGSTVQVSQPGFAVFVPSDGSAPIGPFPLTEAMGEYLDFFLRTEPNGPTENPLDIQNAAVAAGQTQFELPVDPDVPDIDDIIPGIQDPAVEDELFGGDPVIELIDESGTSGP